MKKKTLVYLGLLSISLLCAPVTVSAFLGNADENVQIQIEECSDAYLLNTSFTVPYGKAIVNGNEQAAEHCLVYPDGRKTSYGNVILDIYGEYKLKYFTTVNGKEYSETKEFSVVAGDYTTLFTDLGGCTFTQNVTVGSWCDYDYFNGVQVDFEATGGSFRYNGVIDLSDTTKYDEFVSFTRNLPSSSTTTSSRSLHYVDIKLIDIYNEDNYLYIRAADHDVLTTRVVTCAKDMYTAYGMLKNSAGDYISNTYGPQIYSSFSGKPASMNTGTNAFQLSYDASEKTLYGLASPEYDLVPNLVLDYDDPSMVEQAYIWDGFTTNQVYMEVTVYPWASAETSLIFMSIGGTDLSGEGMAKSKSAQINVDTFGYSENALPNATVNRAYPVFNATAYDNYGIKMGAVNATVYDPSGKLVPLNNGKFIPTVQGRYKIEYTASNAYITDTKTLYVEAGEKYDVPVYHINEEIASEALVGDKICLYDGVSKGGIGKLTVERNVILGDTEIPVYNYGKEDYFYPTQSGDYFLTYTITDQIGESAVYQKVISVADGFVPVMETPNFSKVNIKGKEVRLPRVSAVVYKDEMCIFVPVEVYFDDENITDTLTYIPQVAGIHTIKYVAKSLLGEEYDFIYQVDIQVNDPTSEENKDEPLVYSYFWTDGFEKEYSDKAYRLRADGSTQTASAQFLTALPQEMLELTLAITPKKLNENGETIASYNNFDRVRIRFSDSEKAEEEIVLTLERYTWGAKENVALYVNDKFVSRYATEFGGTTRYNFGYSYDPQTMELLDSDGNVLTKLTSNAQGEEFKGFTSGLVYVTVECDGVKDIAELQISQVGGQVMMATTKDTTGPELIGAKGIISQYAQTYVNKEFELAKLGAFDVFDGEYCDVYVSIKQGSNAVLNAKKLGKNETFTFEEAGTYTITYFAMDAGGVTTRRNCSVVVKDFENPVITVNEVAKSVKVGEVFVIPTAIAVDDSSSNVTLYAYIINTNGVYHLIDDQDEYTYIFNKAGTYILRYVAIDGSGNESVKEFTITAK